ncbi:KxYKxGKxW signal peptide domain-containing protein [Sphingobacterium sp. NGMCC 1.201703]
MRKSKKNWVKALKR